MLHRPHGVRRRIHLRQLRHLSLRIGKLSWINKNLPLQIRFIPVTGDNKYGWVKWQESRDVSADLYEITFAAVCVVCSGAKSMLDIGATLAAHRLHSEDADFLLH